MDKKDLQKIIREGFESSSLNEGMFDKIKSAVGMETELEKAYDLLTGVYTALYLANWEKVESFLKGEKVAGYPKLGLNDIIDNLKGTEAEKPFDDFVKELNQAYRDKIDEYPKEWDIEKVTKNLSRGTNATLDIKELSTLSSAIEKLGDKLKRDTSTYSSGEAEMAEGSARNQTNFRGANLKPGTYPWVKQIDEAVEFEIIEEEDKRKTDRYMFASNLKQMCRQAELMLQQDAKEVEKLLDDGHDWAQDHVAVAKENLDQVFDFMMNKLSQAKEKEEEIDVDLESEEEMEEGIGKSLTVKKGMNAKPKPNQQKEESLEEDSVEEGSARNLTNKKGMNAKPSSLK